MTVPTHFRFVFRGIWLGTPETFSFSMKFSRDNPVGVDAGVGDINEGSVDSAITTFVNTAAAAIPNKCQFTDWRAYQIGTDNKMEGNPLVRTLVPANFAGNTATIYPPQIALCVTSVANNRGPARFGRFYLPTTLALSTSDMRVSAALALSAANAVSTFMKNVSNAIDLEGLQSSAGLNISESGAGARQEIDHLEVGRVLDTLRTRRKALVEDRQATGHIDW